MQKNEKKSHWKNFYEWWDRFKGGLIIWLCRLIAFVWVYCYHDFQSSIILLWILHSTLFKDQGLFKKWMMYFYMPLISLIFLWYYTINIYGLLKWWNDDPDKVIDMYTYGFFQFQIPPLEVGFMFAGLTVFGRMTYQLNNPNQQDKKFQKELISKLGNSKASLFYQFLFLFLISLVFL